MSIIRSLKLIQSSLIDGVSAALGFSGAPTAPTQTTSPSSLPPKQSLKVEQSTCTAPPVATANKTPLMHPMDAPLTARNFPLDLISYTFAEPIIATFRDPAGGRYRAIIARMEQRTGQEGGASSSMDTYLTGPDLVRCNHPDAKSITEKLVETHNSQPDAAPPATKEAGLHTRAVHSSLTA